MESLPNSGFLGLAADDRRLQWAASPRTRPRVTIDCERRGAAVLLVARWSAAAAAEAVVRWRTRTRQRGLACRLGSALPVASALCRDCATEARALIAVCRVRAGRGIG